MSRRFAGGSAWRRQGWPPWQAARYRLRAFWTSPFIIVFNRFGPAMSAHICAAHRLDRRPACLRRRATQLQADMVGDACVE